MSLFFLCFLFFKLLLAGDLKQFKGERSVGSPRQYISPILKPGDQIENILQNTPTTLSLKGKDGVLHAFNTDLVDIEQDGFVLVVSHVASFNGFASCQFCL